MQSTTAKILLNNFSFGTLFFELNFFKFRTNVKHHLSRGYYSRFYIMHLMLFYQHPELNRLSSHYACNVWLDAVIAQPRFS